MRICTACGARYEGSLAICPLDRAPLEEAPDPLIGRRVGGAHRIVEKIGQGAIASVYRARHEAAARDVAVKVLSPAMGRSPSLRERFLREARAANRARHPGIIDIFDVGEEADGLTYLVMELLSGRTLAAEIARGKIAPARAVAIAIELADALSHAHELGVVHRDLKPANVVLVDREGRDPSVKLLDFGLAKVRDELRLTATGALCGTPAYLSPEHVEGADAGAAGDLYALGCVLFEMLTGRPPFEGPASLVLDRHAREPPPRVADVTPGIPPALDAIVARLLEKSPAKRHASAAELARDLSAALERLG